MKRITTEFECEVCKNKVKTKEGAGYPYHEGWCYIYNFSGKSRDETGELKPAKPNQINLKDKHYCSRECLLKEIERVV